MSELAPLRVAIDYRPRVWGGQRLQAAADPIGEAWIVYEQSVVTSGPCAGETLASAAAALGEPFLGSRALATTGTRFPLLIKLLDTADWLSVQVHPNDEQAARLEGAGNSGKAEAWHFLDAEPDAQVIIGLRAGTTASTLARAISEGTLLDHLQYQTVRAGDTALIRTGTIHALGPGLLLYEVQQSSDITYRVFDWNRTPSPGRALHVEQSIACTDPTLQAPLVAAPHLPCGGRAELTRSAYFVLDLIVPPTGGLCLDTEGESFHALTVIEGEVVLRGAGLGQRLGRFQSCVVPAVCGAYAVAPLSDAARVLCARV